MYRNPECFESALTISASMSLPTAAHHYLNRLGLAPVQRRWIEQQPVQSLKEEAARSTRYGTPWFALTQSFLAVLADGDELQARLAVALPASCHATNPAHWLRRQMVPPIARSTMASKPFLKSLSQYVCLEWFKRPHISKHLPAEKAVIPTLLRDSPREKMPPIGIAVLWVSDYPWNNAKSFDMHERKDSVTVSYNEIDTGRVVVRPKTRKMQNAVRRSHHIHKYC